MTRPVAHSEFVLPGVRCAGCISKVENGLRETPGIIGARMNFTAKRVSIDHDPALDTAALRDALATIGFTAEPVVSATGQAPDREGRELARALGVAGFAAMNVMLLSVSVWSGAEAATRDLFHWISAMIAMPAIAYAGRPFFRSAWGAVRRGRTNMDVPISIGVLLATAISLYETAIGGPHAYFDGAISLLFFLLAGRMLDNMMRRRARDGASALLRQTAPGGTVEDADGSTRWITADRIRPGMALHVAMGERIAADGIVETGTSAVDLSIITGESIPQPVSPGRPIVAGGLNVDAPITVRVTAAGPDTSIARMAALMEAAGQGRSRYVRIADRAARYYAPAVHLLAALSFGGWMLAGAGWHQSLLIAVAVLIITCPCALGLAVPAAQVVASGALMRRGILVKDGSALERMAEVDAVRFDKTGTLTVGRPQVDGDIPFAAGEAGMALALARRSRHPLAIALAQALDGQGVVPADMTEIREYPGLGLSAECGGRVIRLGRPDWIGAPVPAGTTLATAFQCGDGRPVLIAFVDQIRPDAAAAVRRLEGEGLDLAILSGDRLDAIAPVARSLGLLAAGQMTPQDKLDAIDRLSRAGSRVLMVGDGLNDGPALAAGHASMAPASASDVGQTAADILFLGDSLMPVPVAFSAARRTLRVVRQNFALAIGYNVLAVPLAIAGMVTPLVAAIAMSTSSIIVIANALRLNGCAR